MPRIPRRLRSAALLLAALTASLVAAFAPELTDPAGEQPVTGSRLGGRAAPLGPAAARVAAVPAADLDLSQVERGLADPTPAPHASERTLARVSLPTVRRVPGCVTRFLEHNWSSRGAVVPRLLGPDHFAVMPNRAGWGDMNALWDFFNRPSTRASSHFIIDWEGHCYYSVPLEAKAWTQKAMNPHASSAIEFIGLGNESAAAWEASAGFEKGARVLAFVSKTFGIPAQVGDTRGCQVVKPGLVDHDELECGNTHWDIGAWSVEAHARRVAELVRPLCTLDRLSIEQALARLRDRRIIVDGVLGWRSRRAIRAIQRENGWPQTGVPGRRVAAALGLCR